MRANCRIIELSKEKYRMTSFAIIALITYVKGPTKMIYLSANSMNWYIGYRGNTQRHIKRQHSEAYLRPCQIPTTERKYGKKRNVSS